MSARPAGTRTRGAWIGWTTTGRARICFRWKGKVHRITLELTRADLAELERIRDLVGAEIRAGIFVPERRFPSVFGPRITISPRAEGPSVAEAMAEWIEEKRLRGVRRSRTREYDSHLRNYVTPAKLGALPFSGVLLSDLQEFQLWLVSRAGEEGRGVHEKTAANVIRGTVQAFIRDRGTPEQLVAVRALKWERYRPGRIRDPFSEDERAKIIAWFAEKRPADELASVALRFQGVTPSEARALRVGDFDRATSSIRIEQSEDEGEIAATKAENRLRFVNLPGWLGARLAALCGLREPGELLIRGIKSERALVHQWKRCLKALGLRWRSIYQTKHTFAVLEALAGTPADEIANHLGVTEETLRKHYKAALNKGRVRRGNATETPQGAAS